MVFTRVKPVAADPVSSSVTPAPVVLRPAGTVQSPVNEVVPVAVVQYWNKMEPTAGALTFGTVNWKK